MRPQQEEGHQTYYTSYHRDLVRLSDDEFIDRMVKSWAGKIWDIKEKIKDEEEKINIKKRDWAPLYASVGIQKIEYKNNETKIKLWIDQETAVSISQIVKELWNCLLWLVAPSDQETFTFERN